MSPFVTFSLIPIIVALAAGFSAPDLETFFLAGLSKVTPIAVMFIFFLALMILPAAMQADSFTGNAD